MTAFPSAQRGALTRLRELHPRAQITVPARQDRRPALRVTLRWPPRRGGEHSLKRTAYILPTGKVTLAPRSMRHDHQAGAR